ncbi:uncharacterized protein LOC117122253 [Anneissia japonica]|uniref:uncharacterized protein LOC117122253 n=1 Tax=Anneissia japonica TaxID=1529436 RepID=UPI0014258FAC|nr:uncharacterized protein LOC117122253 [Anneissia japonica]
MTVVEKVTLVIKVCLWTMLTTEFVAAGQEISSSSTEIGRLLLRQDRRLNHRLSVYGYENFQTESSSEEISLDFKRNFISRHTTSDIPQQRKRGRNRSSPIPIPAHVPAISRYTTNGILQQRKHERNSSSPIPIPAHVLAPIQVLVPHVFTGPPIDPCQPNPCHNDAKCLLKDGVIECHCSKQYIGEFCETINPCLPNPCKNKGRCHLNEKSFSCECERPYTGKICETYVSTKIGLKLMDLLMLSGIDTGTLMNTSIFFAPTDTALMNTPEGFIENLSSDRKALTDFIMWHTIPRCTYPLTDILNMNKIVVPTSGLDNWCPNAISKLTNVQTQLNQVCGRVIDFDEYEGSIFIINKVLMSPTKHIMEVLSTDPRFTEFFQYVQHLVHILRILDQEQVTVLVPTNSAINALPKDIREDRRKLRRVILYHIVIGHVCFPEVSPDDSNIYSKAVVKYTETQDQVIFQLIHGKRLVNDVIVIERDIVARNGVIHYIENTLDPSYVNI